MIVRISAVSVPEVRGKAKVHKRFQEATATIRQISLRLFLQRKGEKGESGSEQSIGLCRDVAPKDAAASKASDRGTKATSLVSQKE